LAKRGLIELKKFLAIIWVVLAFNFIATEHGQAQTATSEDRYKVVQITAGRVEEVSETISKMVVNDGTGFVVGGGYIITNDHVIDDATGEDDFITVYIYVKGDAEYTIPCELVATDARKDLAILKMNIEEAEKYPYFELDLDSMDSGDYEIIGNPNDEKWSYFSGTYIGERDVRLTVYGGWSEDVIVSEAFIKGSGVLGRGGSGSPVINADGKVVAVVNSHYEDNAVAITPQNVKAFLEENGLYDEIMLYKSPPKLTAIIWSFAPKPTPLTTEERIRLHKWD
jgi:S1-C subfamily serine protease